MSWILLYDSLLTATQTIKNTGASVTYMRWEITGPGFYLKLNNLTTSKTWALNYHMREGDMVVITFDPVKRTVLSEYDGSLSSHVTSASEFWGLNPGDNSVYIELGGTTFATRVAGFNRPA